MALFLIFFEIFKQCVVGLTGAPALVTMPLELCSFAEYTILADAMWPKNRILKQLLVFAFLPARFHGTFIPHRYGISAYKFLCHTSIRASCRDPGIYNSRILCKRDPAALFGSMDVCPCDQHSVSADLSDRP